MVSMAISTAGSIPACAGEPPGFSSRRGKRRVHPRVCGGALLCITERLYNKGPSPRVRGSRRSSEGRDAGPRSIPACAGEPSLASSRPTASRVHPRVCGGAQMRVSVHGNRGGPSPRVRGSRDLTVWRQIKAGSIPACAGEPHEAQESAKTVRVHPRVCGGALNGLSSAQLNHGPSPRVRGSRGEAQGAWYHIGSIPACAGEPSYHDPGRRY